MAAAVYVHRAYEQVLGHAVDVARQGIPREFAYTVVKYNHRTGAVSFIRCDDFDSAPEPTVGDLWTVPAAGPARYRRQPADPEVYHHKWLFVVPDYRGFDVAASEARSRWWQAIPGVDRSRIGRRSYWLELTRSFDAPQGVARADAVTVGADPEAPEDAR